MMMDVENNGAARILLADDEIRLRDSQKLLLEREGYSVTVAEDGGAALAILSEKPFDLYVLDISMPVLDGFQLMEKIFARDPSASVIMMTGYSSVDSAVKALKMGAYDYLKKPFEFTELSKAVRNALAQRRLKAENREIGERLKVSERRYRAMVQDSPDLIYMLDAEARFTFVNEAFERILGYRAEDLLGKHYSCVVVEEDLKRAQWRFNERRTGDRATAGVTLRLHRKEAPPKGEAPNSPVHIELKATGCYDPASSGKGSRLIGTYGVARDVTYKKELEAQFLQAQKMEALGTLAGGIAHDFNNILMCIQGYASLLRMGVDPQDPVFKKLVNIEQHVHSGSELTRQLLGFASDNRSETDLRTINLNRLLNKTATMFGRTKKEIEIRTLFAADLWATEVDEGQIKQVLLNLYVNAWQAMPEGGTLTLTTENVKLLPDQTLELSLPPGNYAKVSVIDSGMGMDEAIQHRIFEPFFTTKEMGRGTGLGLASAYGIIKNHEGAIHVRSKRGQGTAFSLYLPSTEKYVEPEAKPQARLSGGRETVLVVDDERRIIEVTSQMLETLGYSVITAAGGGEALDCLRHQAETIDLVILDMVMPSMGGAETFVHLKKIDPGIRVLLTSGYNRQREAEKIIATGEADFLQKPCSLEQLSEKLTGLFSQEMAEPLLSTGTKH